MTKIVRRITIISVPSRRSGTESAVERGVLNMIEAGVAHNISELAAQLHMSPSHLQRVFKRETGERIGEWLVTQRLRNAAYLLSNSYLSVKEIACSTGYEHVSSFIRAFERRYELTPTRYRARTEATGADSSRSVA
jgi:AraC-like DNA-binding protein